MENILGSPRIVEIGQHKLRFYPLTMGDYRELLADVRHRDEQIDKEKSRAHTYTLVDVANFILQTPDGGVRALFYSLNHGEEAVDEGFVDSIPYTDDIAEVIMWLAGVQMDKTQPSDQESNWSAIFSLIKSKNMNPMEMTVKEILAVVEDHNNSVASTDPRASVEAAMASIDIDKAVAEEQKEKTNG